MFRIQISDSVNKLRKKDVTLIKKSANLIFKEERLKGLITFELHIIDSEKSLYLNKTYRNKNNPTDVISFSFWENSLIKTSLLGEIYLNYDKVVSQSIEYCHSFQRELIFLVTHGIYHLLGYDHQSKNDEKIMMNKQYNILKILELGSENDK